MSETTAAAQAAYRESRAEHNARVRWYYAMPLLGIASVMLVAHLLGGSMAQLGLRGTVQGYAMVFAY
ncbi:MAG TPA: hypothetical protein PLN78_02545, partial [Pseudomonadales bacterium]|nr:hypothetical protein [Pseudomonadales bacterium]